MYEFILLAYTFMLYLGYQFWIYSLEIYRYFEMDSNARIYNVIENNSCLTVLGYSVGRLFNNKIIILLDKLALLIILPGILPFLIIHEIIYTLTDKKDEINQTTIQVNKDVKECDKPSVLSSIFGNSVKTNNLKLHVFIDKDIYNTVVDELKNIPGYINGFYFTVETLNVYDSDIDIDDMIYKKFLYDNPSTDIETIIFTDKDISKFVFSHLSCKLDQYDIKDIRIKVYNELQNRTLQRL